MLLALILSHKIYILSCQHDLSVSATLLMTEMHICHCNNTAGSRYQRFYTDVTFVHLLCPENL